MFLQFLKNRKVATSITILVIAMFAFSLYAVFIFSAREASGQVVATTWGAIKSGGDPFPPSDSSDCSDSSSSSGSSSSTEVPDCACGCGWIVSMCPCD